jgi:hypothetical protein
VKADTERTDTDKKHARRLLKHKLKLKLKDQPKKSNTEEEAKGKINREIKNFYELNF